MDWDEHAAGWDDDPAVRAYASAAFDALDRELRLRGLSWRSLRVLDFGCGTGVLAEALAPRCREVVGLDLSAAMIAKLQDKITQNAWTHVHAVAGPLDASRRDDDAPFDLVVCSSVCAFLDDYPATVRALVSRLAPGGLFVQFDWERNDADADPFGLTTSEIDTALRQAGLESITVGMGFERDFEGQVMKPLMGVGIVPS